VAHVRISKGEPGSVVEASFVDEGLDPVSARVLVDAAVDRARSRATTWLLGGLALAGVGVAATAASYSEAAANPDAEAYWIWYGPIITGGVFAIMAIGRLVKIRR
jgi:hypothetical protein